MARLSILCTAALVATLALLTSQEAAAAQSYKKLDGVNYNIRAGADWEPDATKCKSDSVIAQELKQLKDVTDTIRLYSIGDCNQAEKVLKAAINATLKVALGLWVGSDPAIFEAEKTKFVDLLENKPELVTSDNVVGIHVGSEAIYRGDVNTTVAIENFDQIKALCTAKGLAIPVTIADIGDVYLAHPDLIDAVDVVSANAFPFWEKIDADEAAAYLYSRLEPLIELAGAQHKQVVVSETGWATAGEHKDASDATPSNAATYLRDFYALAQQHHLKYYYFAGFDESWKLTSISSNSTVEAYFGLFDKNSKLKNEYKDVLMSKKEAAVAPGTIQADPLDSDSMTDGVNESGGATNSISSNNTDNNSSNHSNNNNSIDAVDAVDNNSNHSSNNNNIDAVDNNSNNNNNNDNDNNQKNSNSGVDNNSGGAKPTDTTSTYDGVTESAAAGPATQNVGKRLDCAM